MATLIDQSAVPVNFKITQGNSLEFIVTIKEAGAAIDVSGFTFLFEMLHPRTGVSVLSLTLGNGIEFEPGLGQVRVTITNAQSAARSPIVYPHHFKFTRPDTVVKTPFAGYFTIQKVGGIDCAPFVCNPGEIIIDSNITNLEFDLGAGIPGPPGPGIPAGGSIGMFLVKTGPGDYQIGWTAVAPGGGTDLSSLPTWPNDADAINLGGLVSGNFYWVSEDSDAHPGGTIRKIP